MNKNISDFLYSVITPTSYLTKQSGNIALILSAPHGGGIKPITIPNRKFGSLLKDTWTRTIAQRLYDSYRYQKPYLLISNIHRIKVDLNRDIEEGAQWNSRAEKIWKDWNYTLEGYKEEVLRTHRKGLYIDIHSHNDNDKFQLGYNINSLEYNRLYRQRYTNASSTLDSLGRDRYYMMFGEHSLHNSLETFGYTPYIPKQNDVYFNGGRNIEEYSGDGLGAIQIEVPVSEIEKSLNKVIYVLKFAIETFRKAFVQ